MTKQLPTSGLEWMTDNDLDDWGYLNCILEVDLDCPEDLHNPYNDYPYSPERTKIGILEKLILNLSTRLITLFIMKIENCTKASVSKLQRFIEVLNSKKVPGWKNTLI